MLNDRDKRFFIGQQHSFKNTQKDRVFCMALEIFIVQGVEKICSINAQGKRFLG
jgi:hypothetical protein